MHKKDRQVKEFQDIVKIMETCDVCRLALHDEEYPYILPLNFGMRVEKETVILYFHGATEGKKYALIAHNNKAAFEMDCAHRLVTMEETGCCTMEYESVIGQGTVELLSEEEKMDALHVLMKHYHKEEFKFSPAAVPHTTVYKLTVASMTGKRRMVAEQ